MIILLNVLMEVANKHAPFKEIKILFEQVPHMKKTTTKCYL
jgi:hypothetical protein